MESRPTAVRTEVRGTVVTVGVGKQVAVVVVVGLSGEERGHRRRSETRVDARVAGGELEVMDLVRRQTRVGAAEVVVVGLPTLLADHRGDAVLSELVGIGQIVLQLPELAVVLLPAHGIGVAGPSAEVHHRLVGLGVGCADIETDFGPVHEVLDRGKLGVDVARELLTAEQILVKHGESDRIRAGVAFADSRGVVAVDVIDRDVRQGREGVEYHTLAAVGKLEVVVGVGESGVDTEFEPILELGVDVGAHRETVEVRTDDRSLLIHVGA